MEVKARYKVSVGSDYITIADCDKNELRAFNNKQLQDLLNQQDNQIKESKKQSEEKDNTIEMLKSINRYDIGEMLTENTKLKQSQKQLAIDELEKLKQEMVLNGNDYCEIRQGTSLHNPADYAWFNYVMFRKLIDNKIKELKGEN